MAEPVVPKTLQEDYVAATQSGDIAALEGVKALGMGTPVAPQAQAQIDRMNKGVAPIEKSLEAVAAKGGIATPQGRLQAQQEAINSFKAFQPEVSFLKGFSQALMGNPNWRNAATEGVIRPVVRFGDDGKAVTAYMAQNSDVPVRVVKDGKNMSYQEWVDGGYQYEKPTETPGYFAKQQTFQAYAKENAKEAIAANVGASIARKKADNANFVLDAMHALKQYGLSNEELNQLTEETTREFSNTDTVRSGLEQLKNAQDSDAIRSALDIINSASGGIDGKVFKLTGDNKFADQTGKSYSLQGLLQMGSNYSSAAERQKRFSQSREQIVESAVLKKLPSEQAKAVWQQAMDRIWQNDQMTSEFNQKYGGLPFLSNPAPYKAGQSMKVAIANALQERTNAELAEKYQQFYQEAAKQGLMVPGSAAAGFVKNPDVGYQSILQRLNEDIAQVNAMPSPQSAKEPVVKREAQKPTGGLTNIMTPSQTQRLGQTVGETALSATPAGVPSNAKLVPNKRTPPSPAHPRGQAIYVTPDGIMHVGD